MHYSHYLAGTRVCSRKSYLFLQYKLATASDQFIFHLLGCLVRDSNYGLGLLQYVIKILSDFITWQITITMKVLRLCSQVQKKKKKKLHT
jgi:hypothetical protein